MLKIQQKKIPQFNFTLSKTPDEHSGQIAGKAASMSRFDFAAARQKKDLLICKL